jgi:UDP-N-acetylglucosamine acyltransferase
MAIHIADNACIDTKAEIADGVSIGPFCVVGPKARIGPDTRLENNVTLMGRVTLGADNHIYPGVTIGGAPQDLSYQESDTEVLIGDRNVIRENVTINRGSEKEEGVTRIGNQCYLMTNSHVAHDCYLGDCVAIANSSTLGGHVHIQDHATLSGLIGVHHFVTIGRYSFVGGMSAVRNDVPPFMLAEGIPAKPRCVNMVALKRNDFPGEVIKSLVEAHRLIYRARVGVEQAYELLRTHGTLKPQLVEFFTFIENQQAGRHGRSRELRKAA